MNPADFLAAGILIAMLGSPHFQTRQSASANLDAMTDRALPVLLCHVNNSDPEVARRVRWLLGASRPEAVDRLCKRHPDLLIDALPLSYKGLARDKRAWLLDHYLAGACWPDPVPPGCLCGECDTGPWKAAVRWLVIDLIYHQGDKEEDVAKLLDQMWARQQEHLKDDGLTWDDEPP